MSSDQKGPSYILSFLSGTLLILGGVVRAASRSLLPNRVFGTTDRIVMRALPSINFGIGPTNILLQVSASLGIISGIAVLIGAVMLSSRAERNALWVQ